MQDITQEVHKATEEIGGLASTSEETASASEELSATAEEQASTVSQFKTASNENHFKKHSSIVVDYSEKEHGVNSREDFREFS